MAKDKLKQECSCIETNDIFVVIAENYYCYSKRSKDIIFLDSSMCSE